MQSKVDILFGVAGQVIHLDVREGRPSSIVSVQVFDDLLPDSQPEADALADAGTIEALTTTLDDDAGAEEQYPNYVPVASTTGVTVGRRLLLSNSLGQREWIDVAGVDAGVKLIAQTPLMFVYESGDEVVSTRITVTLATAWVSEESNASNPLSPRARWRLVVTYVVDGVTCRVAVFFDLTRYTWRPTVTALDVNRRSRGWLGRLAPQDLATAGADVIAEAEQQVKNDLMEHGHAAYAIRYLDVVNDLVLLKAVVAVHEQAFEQGGINEQQLRRSEKAYWDRMDNLVPKANQQVTAAGAGGRTREAPIWRR